MPTRLILQEADGLVQVLLHRDGHLIPEPSGPGIPFEPPLSPEEREDLRWYLEDYLDAPYAVYEDRGSTIAGKIPVWGERLFETVFGPGKPGRDAYRDARAAEPCELWIASRSPAFLGLPWELLKDPERSTPLVLELAGINRTLPAAMAAADPQPGDILHGTDTLAVTGEYLHANILQPPVPIVLTGAMRPFEMKQSDALQNLTEAIFACGVLAPGVYCAAHGRVLQFPGVRKDLERGTFVRA